MFRSSKQIKALRKIALALPDAEEGTSCNKISFKAGKKAFLYLGETDGDYNAKLKLVTSLDEAKELARKHPEIYSAGSNGWVDAEFPADKSPPAGLMERWILESYQALVPKRISAQLGDIGENPKGAGKKSARRRSKN